MWCTSTAAPPTAPSTSTGTAGRQGLGYDEVMTLELDRLDGRYARVVVGVVIQQRAVHRAFVDVINPGLRIREGYTDLAEHDFGGVRRDGGDRRGVPARRLRRLELPPGIRGYDDDPATFIERDGRTPRRP